jgi:hypothetical protein
VKTFQVVLCRGDNDTVEAPEFDIFLSHSGADKLAVERVAEVLRQLDPNHG